MINKKIKLLIIAGPTASGKTALGVELARRLDGEVISADSMQIYKGLDITTAKPSQEEMQGIPHHLISIIDRSQNFSVSDYAVLANQKIQEISARGKLPIMVGGTGLYIDSVVNGLQFAPEAEEDSSLRQELLAKAASEGNQKLYQQLQALDPEACEKIHVNNTVRLVRALEVCLRTGKTFTEYKKQNLPAESPYEAVQLGLNYESRQDLYDRINLRVYKMLEAGMLEEVRQAYQQGNIGTASAAIGYKELIPYLENQDSLLNCTAMIQQESRRYAKRQLTWFRRNAQISWLILSKNDELQEISEKAEKTIAKSGILCYNK
ncbi:MAG: tRNA (adenosine(37)-N6)-dimethylallyltransferase MiaA [Oscillospiraceae bacterium]|nr:tRNA (adenosine(37)-N6)-dimethylallyltransferase MiaA [Oscillospiraceae bacterium]